MAVAQHQNSPFARVSNGYDPKQVAAFAAEALGWKKESKALRSEVVAAIEIIERYESMIGDIEEVEREAAEVVEDAERRAAEIISDAEGRAADILEEADREASSILAAAREQATGSSSADPDSNGSVDSKAGAAWLATEQVQPTVPDPVDQIFDPIDEDELVDAETDRERRVAAAAANLWKRRGVLTPPE